MSQNMAARESGPSHAILVATSILRAFKLEGARRRLGSAANARQTWPNKTKQNCLDLLGFIRPNRDFSKDYDGKIKKIPLSFRFASRLARRWLDPTRGKRYSTDSDFRKKLL
jgi:hypothetical protein